MEADLEAPSGVDSNSGFVNGAADGAGGVGSEETLILKIGGKEGEEGGGQGEVEETELRGDLTVIGNEGVVKDKTWDVEDDVKSGVEDKVLENSDIVDKKRNGVMGDDSLEEADVDIGDSVPRDRIGDDGNWNAVEGLESGTGEKEVVTSDVVDKKLDRDVDVDDDLLEDVDVDIDGSGDVQTSVLTRCGHAAVDVVEKKVGNGRVNEEDATNADLLEKENEMTVEDFGANLCEEIAGNVSKNAIGEPVSGKSGAALHPDGGTVRNVAGESEDEEVDIGGDHEPSLNSKSETVTDSSLSEEGHKQSDTSLKRKHNTRDIVYTTKRERNMDESTLLMGEDYEDDENLHSSSASLLSGKRQNTVGAPKQSFKIGDCIVRAASQLTGTPGPSSFLKSINEKYQKVSESIGATRDVHAQHEKQNINSSSSIVDDVLPQPQSATHDPLKEPDANNIGKTSSSPDNAVDGRNVKTPKSVKGSPEAFEFEDMKDSYWTDRVIQNGVEEKPERKLNYQAVTLQPPASFSRTPSVQSRKRYSNGSHKIAGERPVSTIDKSKQGMLPAELILKFPDMNSIPSEGKLNNMFRRFGPLKEFETEVDRDSNRARVVFKKAYDAEVAFSSCETINIFGSSDVRYELSYTPSVSYKAARLQVTQGMETDSLPVIDFSSSAHDLEFITMQELEDATLQDLQYPHNPDLEGVTMQDLEFTTMHDLEFPGSQDLDTVPTHPSEVASIHLDESAQDQHPATLVMPSSGQLEIESGKNVRDDSSAEPQDMEIAMAEDQQPTNQDPSIKTHEDLASGQVHQIEAVTVQQVEQVINPEIADKSALVDTNAERVAMGIPAQDTDNVLALDSEVTVTEDADVPLPTNGDEILAKEQNPISGDQVIQDKGSNDNDANAAPVAMGIPAQDTDNSLPLDSEVTVTEDADVPLPTSGDEILAKEQDPISGDQVIQYMGSNDNDANADVTTSQEAEVGMDDPMILSDPIAEQDDNLESATDLSNHIADQVTNLENASMAVEESQVASVEDDPKEIEMQDPANNEKTEQVVEIDATRVSVPSSIVYGANERVVTSVGGACETETTEVTPSEIKPTVTAEVPATVISDTGDGVSVVAEETEVETTKHDEVQVAPDVVAKKVTCDDSVDIVETQSPEPQTEEATVPGNVVAAAGVTNVQDDEEEDGLTTEEADEKESRSRDSEKS